MTVRSRDVWRMIVKEDGRSTVDVWGTKVHFKVVYQVWKCCCCPNHFYSISVPLFKSVLLYICTVVQISFIIHLYRCPNHFIIYLYRCPNNFINICTVVQISFITNLYRCPNHFYYTSVPLSKSVLLYICTVVQISFIIHLYSCPYQFYYTSLPLSKSFHYTFVPLSK